MKLSKKSWIYRGAFWYIDADKRPQETDVCEIGAEWIKNLILGPPLIVLAFCVCVVFSPFFLMVCLQKKLKLKIFKRLGIWFEKQGNKLKTKTCHKVKIED